jgi:histone-lysine N-methyltransferase SETMAR
MKDVMRGKTFTSVTMRNHMAVGRTMATFDALVHTLLPHPPYSPDLAPSNYTLFDAMKDVMRGKTVTSNDELQVVVQQWHQDAPKEWFPVQMQKLPNDGKGAQTLAGNTSNIICILFQ